MAPRAKAKSERWKKPMRKRERQVIQIQGLELDIINLQHEIRGLQDARSLLDDRRLASAEDAGARYVDIVQRFYRLLGNGFGDSLWDHDSRQYVDAHAVVRNTFAAHVEVVTVANQVERGRGALETNLLRIGAVLERPRVTLKESHVERADQAAGHVVVAGTTETTGQITEFTLASQCAQLHFYPETRATLMGRCVVAGSGCSYTFDTNSGLVVRVDERVDFVSAIAQLLEADDRSRVLPARAPSIREALQMIRDQQETSVIYEL